MIARLAGVAAVALGGAAACAGHGVAGVEPAAAGGETHEEQAMNGATSPDGAAHPGKILFQDRVTGTEEERDASAVPQTVGWARVDDAWVAVTRVESTGVEGRRRITRFGADGAMLDSTIQAPPPPPRGSGSGSDEL